MSPAGDVPRSRSNARARQATVAVRVQPRSRKDEIVSARNGRVLLRVVAPPVDGRANEAARRLLAHRLGLPPSRVTILRGQGARDKLLRIDGLDQATVSAALGA